MDCNKKRCCARAVLEPDHNLQMCFLGAADISHHLLAERAEHFPLLKSESENFSRLIFLTGKAESKALKRAQEPGVVQLPFVLWQPLEKAPGALGGQNICLLTDKLHLWYPNFPRESVSKASSGEITIFLHYLVLAQPSVCVSIYKILFFHTSFPLLAKIKAEMVTSRRRQPRIDGR